MKIEMTKDEVASQNESEEDVNESTLWDKDETLYNCNGRIKKMDMQIMTAMCTIKIRKPLEV